MNPHPSSPSNHLNLNIYVKLNLSPTQHLHTRRPNFKNSLSPFNTLKADGNARSTESTRLHLSNLERLLRKQPVSNVEEVVATEGIDVDDLQRLLSTTNQYSPRNGLGGRWRKYHGSDDWEGMLNPLDENLRREVVRYGEFVQAAFDAFFSSPAVTSTGEKEEGGGGMPTLSSSPVESVHGSYRVTRNLYVTSSVRLPGWVDDVAPKLGWLTQRSSEIGYVAVCDDRREIQRMGRRDIVIALRGSATCLEWAENLRANLVPVSDDDADATSGDQPKVVCGFLNLYKTSGVHIPSLSESIVREVKNLVQMYENETLSITVTGHSLGAALSLLVADELSTILASDTTTSSQPPPVAVFSFGGPKVGNKAFGDRLRSKNVKVLRIVNNFDIITKVPTDISLNESTKQQLRKLAMVEVTTPWEGYSHVGMELQVDTRMSPYLRPYANAASYHDLEVYLHLVDGLLSPNSPFRSDTKRSLAKLISEQRSNVKRLYTRNAKAGGSEHTLGQGMLLSNDINSALSSWISSFGQETSKTL